MESETYDLTTANDSEEEEEEDDDFLAFDAGTKKKNGNPDDDGASSDMDESDGEEDGVSANARPPWMTMTPTNDARGRIHPLVQLHNEIVNFCKLMEPMPMETRQREALVEHIRKLTDRTFVEGGFTVQVFGSQATGLFLPTSDIDIVISTPTKNEENTDDIAKTEKNGHDNNKPKDEDTEQQAPQEDWTEDVGGGATSLHRFARALRDDWLPELSYLEVVENTRVPVIKFTHAPTNFSVDICFDQSNGVPAAQLTKTYLDALPPLKPLTLVLKYFLTARGLNEPYSGGVGSFMLQLMIVAYLQQAEREAVHFSRPRQYNLGCLLLEFLELYGMNFNYCMAGISVRHDGFFFPKAASDRKAVYFQQNRPFSLALENPLDISMDVGKSSFRISMVQRAFGIAYKTLLAYVAAPAEPTPSILATIVPPTPAMFQRRSAQMRNRPLAARRHTNDPRRK